jgi:alkyl hydroperoxide reductase subunit AhpF
MELGEPERDAIRELLAGLEREVPVLLEFGPEEAPVAVLLGGRELDFGAETRSLLEHVASLSDAVRLTVADVEERGPWPRTTIAGKLVYHGLPWGYELATLVHGIAEAGRGESTLSMPSLAALARLEHDVALEVFVTPT